MPCSVTLWNHGKWVTENCEQNTTRTIFMNESNPWDVLTIQIHGMPAQCASLPCITTPPATMLSVLWGPILCIEGTHSALAQSRHQSTLLASFASCSSRLYVQCMVPRICRTMKSPQQKLSHMSRHARTACVPCLWRVKPRQTLQCSSTHPPKQ